ncbi:MAG TPA: hypothetical protein PLR41_11795 [Alphaproteobacteria bacterium]|nr:hypothetical protein [Alphaproteobacteria bacterium]
MAAAPDAPGSRRFTIGGVLATAARGLTHHGVAVLAFCLAAGILATLGAPFVAGLLRPILGFLWRTLAHELALIALAILVALPAIPLLLAGIQRQGIGWRQAASQGWRRSVVVLPVQVVIDALLVLPTYLLVPGYQPGSSAQYAWLGVIVLYQLPILAFNYIYLMALVAEPIGPGRGAARAFSLLSGHWIRMLAIAGLISIAGIVAVFATTLLGRMIFGALLGWVAWGTTSLAFSLRLLVMIVVASAAYHRLCLEKDGGPADETARVFD